MFDAFDTEGGYDFVYIYDGYNNMSTQLAVLSGYISSDILANLTYQTTQYQMFIQFTSDPIIPRTGFSATYSSIFLGEQAFNHIYKLSMGEHLIFVYCQPAMTIKTI